MKKKHLKLLLNMWLWLPDCQKDDFVVKGIICNEIPTHMVIY